MITSSGMSINNLLSATHGSMDNYLKTIIFKEQESASDYIIESNILPQYILGAKVSCFVANYPNDEEVLKVSNLDGKIITAPISILLGSGHYDVYVLSQTLSPNDKTYEKLKWYSQELLINKSIKKKFIRHFICNSIS